MNIEINFINILIFILIIIILYYLNDYIQRFLYKFNGKIYIDKLKKPEYNLENKKVAICISGQIRDGYQECLLLLNLFLIYPLNADIFCSFEDCDDEKKNYINKELKPKKTIYVSDYIKNENNIISNGTLSMYNKIYLSNKLKIDYEIENNFKYDYVIRVRPDIIIKEFLPKYVFENDTNILYFPRKYEVFGEDNHRQYPDFIAIGNSKIMDIYSNIFLSLVEDLNNKCNVSEMLLFKYLDFNNIECVRFLFPYNIYRFKFDSLNNMINLFTYSIYLSDRYIFNNNC